MKRSIGRRLSAILSGGSLVGIFLLMIDISHEWFLAVSVIVFLLSFGTGISAAWAGEESSVSSGS